MDKTGQKIGYIFWMLHPAGGSKETDDKLVSGKYSCYTGHSGAGGMIYADFDIQITLPNTYQTGEQTGRFRVEPSRRIVFETGPFVKVTGHLLDGPTIGLNQDGGTFYATTCDHPKK